MKFKAVIFDLDGTLLDTLEDIASAMNRVLERQGSPIHDVASYRHFVGEGVRTLITRVLPEEKRYNEHVDRCIEEFRKEYALTWNVKTKAYDGVPEMLDELTSLRLMLAVLSNKPNDFTKKCVDELLPQWNFDVVLGYHDGILPKPDPEGALLVAETLGVQPAQVLYLGDTSVDMQTATAAGMLPVGALWGFRSLNELQSSGAKAVIKRPQDILTILKGKEF